LEKILLHLLQQDHQPLTTQPGTRLIDYLVVAGGGGGGAPGDFGGGGGAGGFRTGCLFSVCGSTPYPLVVGGGGAGGSTPSGSY
jgi:hypothetical protein